MRDYTPIRSLHIVASLDKGGGGALHNTITLCCVAAEHIGPADLLGTIGPEDDIGYLGEYSDEFQPLTLNRCFPARFANARGLETWLARNGCNYDVVVIHGVWTFLFIRAARICRNHRLPYLVRPCGSLDPFDLQKKKNLKRLLGPIMVKPMLEKAAGVLCTSQEEANCLESYGAKGSVTKYVSPLPVAQAEFTGQREIFRNRIGVGEDVTVIIFFSRIDYKKGLELLLEAVARLNEENEPIHLVIAGDGERSFVDKIREDVNSRGLQDITTFVGWLSGQSKADGFAGSDIFALPSQNENFGMAIAEAGQAGLPLLLSDQVHIARDFAAVGGASVCRVSAESCYSELKNLLLKGRSEQKSMGFKAQKYVAETYAPEKVAEKLTEIFSHAVRL